MRNAFGGFYNGKKVFVTGHTGFKGSWLAIWLHEMGAQVCGYALEPYTEKDNFVVSKVGERIESHIADVRDYDTLLRTMQEFAPDIVLHLAAQPLVKESYIYPRETYETNVMGTANLLEAIRHSPSVQAAVIISTDKCYENREWVWGYREIDPMGGHDPYSSSKGAAELVIDAYRRSFFADMNIGIASARAGNVIGGGDWAKYRIIPDCVKTLSAAQPIEVRSPHSYRPWQHVLEPVSGYLLLAQRVCEDASRYAGAWNFGPEHSSVVTVKELVEKVVAYWGSGEWRDISEREKGAHHEARALGLDIAKAKSELHWQPALSFQETIALTLDWYKEPQVEYDFCVRQIEQYAQAAQQQHCTWTYTGEQA